MSRKKSTPAAKRRVFLVDDHPIVITGFTLLINAQPDIEVCGTAISGEEAIEKAVSAKPELLITDITLPGRNGLELIKDLRAILPDLKILVVSMHDELLYAERALRAGARGYLMKEEGAEKVLAAIRHVLSGQVYVSKRMESKILNAIAGRGEGGTGSPVEKLSDREFEVFRLLGEGRSTKDIADQLHLSVKTVAVHRQHIKEKLCIGSATELVHHAFRWVNSSEA